MRSSNKRERRPPCFFETQNNTCTHRLKKFTFLRGGNSEVVFSQIMSEFLKGKKGGQGLLYGIRLRECTCYLFLFRLRMFLNAPSFKGER